MSFEFFELFSFLDYFSRVLASPVLKNLNLFCLVLKSGVTMGILLIKACFMSFTSSSLLSRLFNSTSYVYDSGASLEVSSIARVFASSSSAAASYSGKISVISSWFSKFELFKLEWCGTFVWSILCFLEDTNSRISSGLRYSKSYYSWLLGDSRVS